MLHHCRSWRGEAKKVCIHKNVRKVLLLTIRRFEIQDADPEPDDDGNMPAPYRASINSLVPIPITTSGLAEFTRGKQVYALYPDSTTFYKAEMRGMKTKDICRLRFEGEEERDKEMEVERRYVLDTSQVK